MAGEGAWVADLAFENAATGDGRFMMADAISWRDLPVPLMALTETGVGGHQGAQAAGKILRIEHDTKADMDGNPLPPGVVAVRGYGVFDMEGPNGIEAERLVREEIIRGISVDPGEVTLKMRNPETGEIIDPAAATAENVEAAMLGQLQTAFASYEIGGATICPTPAFANAKIAVTAAGNKVAPLWVRIRIDEHAFTASAAGLAPPRPPRAWFYTPEARQPTPLTVTKDGRVFGHMALWDSCHTGFPGQCVPPPRSQSGYTYFNLGEVECADGTRVPAGAITLEGLHADTRRPLPAEAVREHYENTAVVAAFVRPVDGRYGIWVAGALRADLSERHARDLMGAKPSGDWRQMRPGGPLEMLGIHSVNNPGYPVPRLAASAMTASGERVSLEFADPDEHLDRRLRVLAARAEGGTEALLDLAGV